ncbi:hypothetical protein K470DRAFT_259359 [Piedraia hortae CBS 480.64]|uniref:Uncharacterized protein n=1 Tax=Piedraia hortae CBS 480.64 TaxID=1314780 RepID=A0A6A7BUP8_9PEZI|nr:hypothetical protein K470DRAFT_259359 [Piedraia hortae CBS 480.64]
MSKSSTHRYGKAAAPKPTTCGNGAWRTSSSSSAAPGWGEADLLAYLLTRFDGTPAGLPAAHMGPIWRRSDGTNTRRNIITCANVFDILDKIYPEVRSGMYAMSELQNLKQEGRFADFRHFQVEFMRLCATINHGDDRYEAFMLREEVSRPLVEFLAPVMDESTKGLLAACRRAEAHMEDMRQRDPNYECVRRGSGGRRGGPGCVLSAVRWDTLL